MADAKTAIDFVLKQEDATLSGKVTDPPEDSGARTRFGIPERWHPEITATGFYDAPVDVALAQAETIYRDQYWIPMQGNSVVSQDFANRLLSFCINMGTHSAVTILQRCLAALGAQLGADGDPGYATISALNAQLQRDEGALMKTWRAQLLAYYLDLVARKPSQKVFLNGWKARIAD
jgi:lysozyme family protein